MSELERYAALRWYGRHGDALHLDLAEYCCKRMRAAGIVEAAAECERGGFLIYVEGVTNG